MGEGGVRTRFQGRLTGPWGSLDRNAQEKEKFPY